MAFSIISPVLQLLDNSAEVLNGGKVYVYSPGTTTPKSSYPTAADADAATNANANPVILSSAGRAQIWGRNSESYKVVVTTSSDVVITTIDVIASPTGSTVTFTQSGDGATTRTMQTELRDWVKPEHYGAVGDGATDDSTAMGRALDNADVITLSRGRTYLLDSWTKKSISNKTIIGNGATIKGDGTVAFIQPSGSLSISGVIFEGFTKTIESIDPSTTAIDSLDIGGCEFVDMDNISIHIDVPLTFARIVGNKFDGAVRSAIVIGEDDDTEENTWAQIVIHGNDFANITATGSTTCSAVLLYGREVSIIGNTIKTLSSANEECWGIYTKARYISVHGNVISGLTSSGSTCSGIVFKGDVRGGSDNSPLGHTASCTGNIIFDVVGRGIRAQQGGEVVIKGNLVDKFTLDGITLDQSGAADNLLISGNILRCETKTSTVGIRHTKDGRNTTMSDNIILGVGVGIRMQSLDGTGEHILVHDNIIQDVTSAVQVNTSFAINKLDIKGNLIADATNGIVNTGSGVVDEQVSEGNRFVNVTNKFSLSTPPTVHRIRNNYGYVSENGGITGAIATGATVSHGLAVTPGVVTVTAASSGPTDVYLSAVGATTFVINFGGGGSHTFYWEAKIPNHYV